MSSEPPARGRTLRTAMLAVSAWVAVVALGSTLVWAVISRAGEGVVGAPFLAPETAHPTARPHSSSGTETPRATQPATESPTGSAPASPTESPTPGPSPGSTPGDTPGNGSQQRTWNGAVGSVTASCSNGSIAYVSAIPRNGFRLVGWEGGGQELQVTFAVGGEDGPETEVQGRCEAGAPTFTASSGDA